MGCSRAGSTGTKKNPCNKLQWSILVVVQTRMSFCVSPSLPERLAGAGSRVRTDDLLITNQLLYQLSYTGMTSTKPFVYWALRERQADFWSAQKAIVSANCVTKPKTAAAAPGISHKERNQSRENRSGRPPANRLKWARWESHASSHRCRGEIGADIHPSRYFSTTLRPSAASIGSISSVSIMGALRPPD